VVADKIDPFDELAPWFMAPSGRSFRTAAQHPVRRWQAAPATWPSSLIDKGREAAWAIDT